MRDDSAEVLFQSPVLEAIVSMKLWHGQGCPLFDVVYTAFPLPITALPILQGALKDGSGKAVVARKTSCPNHGMFSVLCRLLQVSANMLRQKLAWFRHVTGYNSLSKTIV